MTSAGCTWPAAVWHWWWWMQDRKTEPRFEAVDISVVVLFSEPLNLPIRGKPPSVPLWKKHVACLITNKSWRRDIFILNSRCNQHKVNTSFSKPSNAGVTEIFWSQGGVTWQKRLGSSGLKGKLMIFGPIHFVLSFTDRLTELPRLIETSCNSNSRTSATIPLCWNWDHRNH